MHIFPQFKPGAFSQNGWKRPCHSIFTSFLYLIFGVLGGKTLKGVLFVVLKKGGPCGWKPSAITEMRNHAIVLKLMLVIINSETMEWFLLILDVYVYTFNAIILILIFEDCWNSNPLLLQLKADTVIIQLETTIVESFALVTGSSWSQIWPILN